MPGIHKLTVGLDSLRLASTPFEMSAGGKCLTNLCVLDEIIVHVDGKTILQLAMTCRWVWGQLKRSRAPWMRALLNHEDLAPFPGAYLRTPRTLVILHFSSECVMCGLQTTNSIVGNHAVRLCAPCSAQYLVAIQTHTIWQNGPRPGIEPVFLPDIHRIPLLPSTAQLYPAGPFPDNSSHYVTSRSDPAEWSLASEEATTAPAEYYGDAYLNPTYSGPDEINRGCGFPPDLDDDDSQGMQPSSHMLTDNHGALTNLCVDYA